MTTLRFEHDDGGRAAAGFKGDAGDCVCRAIAITTGRPYAEVYAELSAGSASERASRTKRGTRRAAGKRSARNGIRTGRKWFDDYMAKLGFVWVPTMKIGAGCTVHVRAGEVPSTGRHVLKLSKHCAALVEGVIRDTYDPSRGGDRCVYGYWTLRACVDRAMR